METPRKDLEISISGTWNGFWSLYTETIITYGRFCRLLSPRRLQRVFCLWECNLQSDTDNYIMRTSTDRKRERTCLMQVKRGTTYLSWKRHSSQTIHSAGTNVVCSVLSEWVSNEFEGVRALPECFIKITEAIFNVSLLSNWQIFQWFYSIP